MQIKQHFNNNDLNNNNSNNLFTLRNDLDDLDDLLDFHLGYQNIISSNSTIRNNNNNNNYLNYYEIDEISTMENMFINNLQIKNKDYYNNVNNNHKIKNNDCYNVNKYHINNCVICFENFKVNEKIIKLNCFHIFHKECIENWLNKNNICPVCKNKYMYENIIKYEN